ncbi:MAG: hypothetical protein JW743_00665 [Deltaproteobacteria bacterium]|nr:hypothetical protein [Deltaproteobacteria bacterium]MBN2845053.1 hypothetical protein [Deltaproteobacteria bacterium]
MKDDHVGVPAFITYNALKVLGIWLVSELVYRLVSSVEIDLGHRCHRVPGNAVP